MDALETFESIDSEHIFVLGNTLGGSIGLIAAVVGTYATEPTDKKLLERFYLMTRPFGFWGKMKELLPHDQRAAMRLEHKREILALPFTMVWQVTMYLIPMQILIRTWPELSVSLLLHVVGLAGMYFLWYRHLPKTGKT